MSRAEVIMDRTAVKIQKSKGHAKAIHARKKTWDEINKEAFELTEEQRKLLSKKERAKMEEDAMVEAFYADDGDAEMEGADELEQPPGTSETSAAPAASAPAATAEGGGEEEDEIL